MKIAVLLTCHNRLEKTLICLKSLFAAALPQNYELKVFLVDDGSTDGTSKAVKDNFPKVNIIQGDGNLFWNQGMRLAWDTAVKQQDYDFYLWLNDDTLLDDFAINEIFKCYYESKELDGKVSIIVGACRASFSSNEFSYGGRIKEDKPVIPNGFLQQCRYINGNIVLVPKGIFEKIGNLSSDYTHAMGDFDYGLRSIEAGYKNYITRQYVAVCPKNDEMSWSNPDVALRKRFELFKSPKGLNINEYLKFRKKFYRDKWIVFAVKAYAKVLFPSLYNILKG